MKIEAGKWYVTRAGDKVRVICTDANEHMPVVGIDRHGIIDCYSKHGSYRSDGESPNDLISEYVEPPKPMEVWVYISEAGTFGCTYTDGERDREVEDDPKFAARMHKFREVIE